MNKVSEKRAAFQPAPLRVSRVFSAPRETVFKAWSSAEHIKRWFCPDGYSVPDATIEMRVGGAFEVCMRSPEGQEHWTRGTFTEVRAPERLAIDHRVIDPCGGGPLFSALTEVDFVDQGAGHTLMEVVQTYTLADPAQAELMIKGAPEGWRQTLDKLEAEIKRMQENGGGRSVVHGAFHLERTYEATAEQVFTALSNEAAKSLWFFGPTGWRFIERRMDFRVGGRERVKGGFEGGVTTTFDAIYHDIVPLERIVYSYEMHLDERKLSVSLATLQIKPAAQGRTKLLVDEQGAFLDGYDDAGSRERGTGDLLDKLGKSLKSQERRSQSMTSHHESSGADRDPAEIVKRYYRAYVDKDGAAMERLIAEDFHFTSPLDNRLDRKTYFDRCWPNCRWIAGFDFIAVVPSDDRAYVTTVGHSDSGRNFRNTEVLTIQGGKVVEVEVYFGWNVPHPASPGGFVEDKAQS